MSSLICRGCTVDPVWGFFLLGGMGRVAVSTARALSIFWVFTCLCLMRRGAEVNFVRSNVQIYQ